MRASHQRVLAPRSAERLGDDAHQDGIRATTWLRVFAPASMV
jgi:hypothetical protein